MAAGDRTAMMAGVLAALLAMALVTSPAQAQLSGIICTTKCRLELVACLAGCPQEQRKDSVSGALCDAACIVKYNLCTAQCPKKHHLIP